MPYRRTLRLQTALFAWHQLELLAPAADWSPAYEVDSPRLLIPEEAQVELDLGDRRVHADPLLGVWLLPGQPYRVRQPLRHQHSSLLVMGGALPRRRAGPLRLDAAWRLRLQALGGSAQADMQQVEAALAAGPAGTGMQKPPLATESTHAAVERARAFLAARFAENDSLAAIGQAAACSPYQLARLFRRHTGRSLHGHRTALRLAEALRRLEQGEAHLGRLAADLGFASHSHFSAVCRAVLGRSPAAMRTILTARRAR